MRLPFDVEKIFGRKRVPIKATIDGIAYRGSLVRMGGPCHVLLVRKDIREKIGKGPGDKVDIVLEEDIAPRVVEIPPDLAKEFKARSQARIAFRNLSFTHQREYVRWIEEAKRPETRARRIAQTLNLLRHPKVK